MGLLRRKKSFSEKRAEAKALKAKSVLEAKLGAKNDAKRDRSLSKHASRQLKVQSKLQLKSDKTQLKIARENARAQIMGRTLSVSKVKRYLQVARLIAPVLIPIAIRTSTEVRGRVNASRAAKLGVPITEVGNFTGKGGALSARIVAARAGAGELATKRSDAETKAFETATIERLNDLAAAVGSAEHMPPSRRKRALAAVAHELDGVEADLLARYGIGY